MEDLRAHLFQLLLALSVLSFLGIQQAVDFLLLLVQNVLLKLLLFGLSGFDLKTRIRSIQNHFSDTMVCV